MEKHMLMPFIQTENQTARAMQRLEDYINLNPSADAADFYGTFTGFDLARMVQALLAEKKEKNIIQFTNYEELL